MGGLSVLLEPPTPSPMVSPSNAASHGNYLASGSPGGFAAGGISISTGSDAFGMGSGLGGSLGSTTAADAARHSGAGASPSPTPLGLPTPMM